ncbi:M56 family metallopeptidase [Flavivirga eckloniae]|uniref:Peptidase M56 domain-containing protein n=1 Tax=Flavivirga eckloniae TaxID=1803846 RepID=A0A2K9PV50_9FLAO|nr:M56 family metallopeptidase [Flavivirga eckloniae]AUP80934.1 hypothetical protein C1H87_20360 [Flavivirga eckloniae]
MILYILRFSLAVCIFYCFYKFILEKEKIHTFNRFYLLGGLFVSLVFPLISIGGAEQIQTVLVKTQQNLNHNLIRWELIIVSTYVLITFSLLVRFMIDIYKLSRKVKRHEVKSLGRAKLVFTNEPISPYTFLNYIYINKSEYTSLEPELINHELAHVNQRHTIDIFFVELLKTIFWINPLLKSYKTAMQLNHEFLADRNVITQKEDTEEYQNILLRYLQMDRPIRVTSGFNFTLTKKRLFMMKKQKSKNQRFKQLLVIPLFLLAFWSCSDNGGVSGKEMLHYWRYTAAMEEILQTGRINEDDLKDGVIKGISGKEEYDKLLDIYNRMNNDQKRSVYQLPPFIAPIE